MRRPRRHDATMGGRLNPADSTSHLVWAAGADGTRSVTGEGIAAGASRPSAEEAPPPDDAVPFSQSTPTWTTYGRDWK